MKLFETFREFRVFVFRYRATNENAELEGNKIRVIFDWENLWKGKFRIILRLFYQWRKEITIFRGFRRFREFRGIDLALFTWYFYAISWCRFQTQRLNTRTVNIQMLIWRHICFAMTSLIAQCTFKIANVCQQRWPCICFDKVAIIAICIQFTTVSFWSYNFL